jgi:hypothetical protein
MKPLPTSVVIEPRSFQFFGKKWTEVTVMGQANASVIAGHLVETGSEFHHEPPADAGTASAVHRFLIAAAPADVEQAIQRALSPGRRERTAETATPER